ncbi:ribonuclease activity regulator RraA [Nocardioides sp. LHD-245]|uniref:ribonuclease activity regulator RraA n=1 Tax=Nocardioides sp. LHD-245 TaxID=3051387 RepID=UPI0027E1D8F2|nr:ribonuclease activity regulator RraA [Nocardioides sp. LHD-245]
MEPALDPAVFARLRRASTATIQSQLFKRGLRDMFLFGLRPMNPESASFAGEAYTLRYIPAREDLDVLDVFDDPAHPQRAAVEAVPPGQVLVMDCRQDARAASGGNILMTRLQARGVAAMVTDASVRDSPAIAGLELPVYCAGVSATVNLVLHHAVDVQVPIGCAGVPVYPGDVVVGDAEGVVVVPRHLAEEVSHAAVQQEELEEFILGRIQSGQPLRGNYPPDERTLAEFSELHPSAPDVSTNGSTPHVQIPPENDGKVHL